MGQLVVSIVGGLLLGGMYALIGLGLVQAFRSTGTFNFAHGQLMLIPAFMFAGWTSSGAMPVGIAIAAALLLSAVGAVAMFVVVLRPTIGLPHFVGFAATLGVSIALQGAMQLWFGSAPRRFELPLIPDGRMEVLGVGVSKEAVVLALGANAVALVVALVMRYSDGGIRIRAAGQDALLASQGGINVRRVYLYSWALAGTLAALAGLVYGSTNEFDTSSTSVALVAAPAIVLGGLDSLEGAAVGGVVIGLIQGFTASYIGGDAVTVVTYALLLLVLLVYPAGLFGKTSMRRV